MPTRPEPFINNRIYHIFNKTIDSRSIFISEDTNNLFLDLLYYYRSNIHKVSHSSYKRLTPLIKNQLEKQISKKKYFQIEILSYCLMPNHYHLLLLQKKDDGIKLFMANIINALTRHFNLLNKRTGPIFLPKFKSEKINGDEQLIHVSRYIHLNPYSGGLIKDINALLNYNYSSYSVYITGENNDLINQNLIMRYFNNDKNYYKNFVLGNAEYQKKLKNPTKIVIKPLRTPEVSN